MKYWRNNSSWECSIGVNRLLRAIFQEWYCSISYIIIKVDLIIIEGDIGTTISSFLFYLDDRGDT